LDVAKISDPTLEGNEASSIQFSLGNAFKKLGKIDSAIKVLSLSQTASLLKHSWQIKNN
jgi:hypothetical protein